jgi:hypothetical protein
MTFIHKGFSGKRDYEATQVVAAEADHQPGIAWTRCDRSEFEALVSRGASKLYRENGVQYFGWL